MSLSNDYFPYDDMDEEEYYFHLQRRINEEWEWYEHEKKLENEANDNCRESLEDRTNVLYNRNDYSSDEEAIRGYEEIKEFIVFDLPDYADKSYNEMTV